MYIRTSPHRPTTSNKSFRPNDKSTIHLLTAFEDRSGVKSSSAISTQPSERTANRIGRSESDFNGKLRRLFQLNCSFSNGQRKLNHFYYFIIDSIIIIIIIIHGNKTYLMAKLYYRSD